MFSSTDFKRFSPMLSFALVLPEHDLLVFQYSFVDPRLYGCVVRAFACPNAINDLIPTRRCHEIV